MNQFRIGKFISECRKKKGITQNELAELLGVTNRAVSKWETGICMPDAGTIPELCQILDISISDLFSGEKIMENNKDSEKFILKLVKEKAERDKQLLILEILIGILSTSVLVSFILLASFINVSVYVKFIIILCGIILFAVGIFYALLIERIAGYYECSKCHHKYIPTYKQILFSMHAFRTRYMKCPKCKCSSWSKKVIS